MTGIEQANLKPSVHLLTPESDSQILEAAIHKERIRPDEIFLEMHKAGIEHLSEVKWGILESDGKVSFVRSDGGETQEASESTPV